MRGVPRDGKARKGQGTEGDAGEMPDVRPTRKLFGPTRTGQPIGVPTGDAATHIAGARIVSPNVQTWSRNAAVSAAAKRRGLREAAKLHALNAYLKANRPVYDVIDVMLIRYSPRQMDIDNCIAGMKPIRDGVADAFKMRDDDPRIEFWYAQESRRPGEYSIGISLCFYCTCPSALEAWTILQSRIGHTGAAHRIARQLHKEETDG